MSMVQEAAIPSHVKRFLDVLDEYGIVFNDEKYRSIYGPFYVKPLESTGSLLLMASENAEWGEIRHGFLQLDEGIWEPVRSLIQRIWAESAIADREHDLLNEIAILEAELAVKTARRDQIAAILKASP